MEKMKSNDAGRDFNNAEALEQIAKLESENIELLSQLSRFSRRKQEKREPINLHKAIEDSLRLIFPLARMSGIIIEKLYEEGLPLVMADENQIQEVLVTLLLNLLGDVPAKSKLTVRTCYLKEGNCAKIVLSGAGLTEPFPGDKEAATEVSLGASVVYEIIARHKGTIGVEGVPGRGVTIVIQLPVA